MQRIYLLIGLVYIYSASFGQQNLVEYKNIVATEIQKHFEFRLVKTKCTVDSKIDTDGREAFFTNNYAIKENDKESFIKITLEYSIFSEEINDWLSIMMTLDSNKVIEQGKTNFTQIPICILKNQGCKFIKRETAIAIAIRDSILYTDNLKTYFRIDEKSGKYFWTVRGLPKTKSKTKSSKQYRKIDALSGEIIK